MAVTLEEVAQLAGVSRSTVSRVINDRPNVRPETRERVWEAVEESGYRPHAVARSLVTSRTQIIGMVILEAVTRLFTDPFFPLFLRGATGACRGHRYHMMLSLFNGSSGRDEAYEQVLRNDYLDGVILSSFSLDDAFAVWLLEAMVPFVTVGRHSDERVRYVDVDNVGGARMAVEHLIRLGHRRVGTITGRLDMASGQDRLTGYRQALHLHRIPEEADLVAEGDYTENGGGAAMRGLLEASPTAVFAASDAMAIGAMKAVREAGLEVPQDIALVGFDDSLAATAVEPALTTVRQPIERLGGMAVEVLLSMLKSPSEGTTTHRIILPTELIVRASCGSS